MKVTRLKLMLLAPNSTSMKRYTCHTTKYQLPTTIGHLGRSPRVALEQQLACDESGKVDFIEFRTLLPLSRVKTHFFTFHDPTYFMIQLAASI